MNLSQAKKLMPTLPRELPLTPGGSPEQALTVSQRERKFSPPPLPLGKDRGEGSRAPNPSHWKLAKVAGRFVEISGSGAAATLTLACELVLEAQRQGEIVGWVTSVESFFYPPDVAEAGIDLAALTVVRVRSPENIARAGEKLLRGGFGLVILDLGAADIPMPLQTRMAGLAHRHHAGLVCLTEKSRKSFSLSSLVSLRVHAERKRAGEKIFRNYLRVLKDKREGPAWAYAKVCNGTAGLC